MFILYSAFLWRIRSLNHQQSSRKHYMCYEVLKVLNHLAISVPRSEWNRFYVKNILLSHVSYSDFKIFVFLVNNPHYFLLNEVFSTYVINIEFVVALTFNMCTVYIHGGFWIVSRCIWPLFCFLIDNTVGILLKFFRCSLSALDRRINTHAQLIIFCR